MPRKTQTSAETENRVFAVRLRECMNEIRADTGKPTTQEQLAAAVGVIRQTVSNYMNGQSDPDWETLAKIAQYFNVSTDYLVGLHDAPAPAADVRAACDYTGLSEHAAMMLNSAKDEKILKSICEATIFDRKLDPRLVKDCISSFLADSSSYSFFASLANLRECGENAEKTVSTIQAGDYDHTPQQQRKALEKALKDLEIAMFHLTESTRYIAEMEIEYSMMIYHLNRLIRDNVESDSTTEGGAHDAENSPES